MLALLLTMACGQFAVLPAMHLKLPPAKPKHFEVKPVPNHLSLQDSIDDLLTGTNELLNKNGVDPEITDFAAYFGLHHPLPDEDKIRLLNMNTWYGGNMVAGGTQMIADTIDYTNPHIVVLQEVPFAKHLQVALAAKGKMYHVREGAEDVAVLSKWPISAVEAVPGTDQSIVAYHMAFPWGKLVVGAMHLDYEHYGGALARGYDPNQMLITRYNRMEQKETNVASILAEDDRSKRGPQIQAWINYVSALPKETAVILAGDANEPSHLDWTSGAKDSYDHNGLAIPWRRSQMLAAAGFHDSYREKHPNPISHPGHTWPAHAWGERNTAWSPSADERERIDFVYHNRRLQATSAGIMGGRYYWKKGVLEKHGEEAQDEYPMDLLPWMSDHKGLLFEYRIMK